MTPPRLIVISGPTASGKSLLADSIASERDAIIINADSMQVYKELPTLTAQPQDLRLDKHYLYGVFDYTEECSAGVWASLAADSIRDALAAGKNAIVVGGTGFYLRFLLEGVADIPEISLEVKGLVRDLFEKLGKENFHKLLAEKDPYTAKNISTNDTQRMMRAMAVYEMTGYSISYFQKKDVLPPELKDHLHICLMPDRDFLYQNCNARLETMVTSGVLEEIKLLQSKVRRQRKQYSIEKAIGFRELSSYLDGSLSLADATGKAKQLTRNYAKRQLTWFRNQMPNKTFLYYSTMTELIDKWTALKL